MSSVTGILQAKGIALFKNLTIHVYCNLVANNVMFCLCIFVTSAMVYDD